jgi:uncharacterized protein (TIGR00661 family)
MQESSRKDSFHILVAPLDWGLGHATRIIPLIHELLKRNCRVTVAASGKPLDLLKKEFSSAVGYEEFPGTEITYSRGSSQFLKLSYQAGPFIYGIYREKKFTEKLVERLKPDIIISDNRYGVRSDKVFSVLVTHQLNVKLPFPVQWTGKMFSVINRQFINSFDLCLVPDYAEAPGLSGEMTHNLKGYQNILYSGPLSRFSLIAPTDTSISDNTGGLTDALPKDFIVVILSGPEPQRTILEDLLSKELADRECIWFRALPNEGFVRRKGCHTFYDHADSAFMYRCIQESNLVISRSGYTTVMDLAVAGKKCIMIPTPGQSEQEYLGKFLHQQGYIVSLSQNRISELKKAISEAKDKSGLPVPANKNDLEKAVDRILRMAEEKKLSLGH